MSAKIELVPTGIGGLDELLGGGIPKGHIVSIFGGPGTGKTTLAMQFLYNGASKYDEPGIFVSLDESPTDLKRHMSAFGWNIDELENKNKLVILDVSPTKHIASILKMKTSKERMYSLLSISNIIKGTADNIGAKRVVIDPMSTLIFQYPELGERRLAIMNLLKTLKTETKCTSLITLDLRATALEREYQLEEYLTQGTILLQRVAHPQAGLTRVILIEKMRGIDHDTQPHPYAITKQGIQVFSKEKIYVTGLHS